MIAKKKGQVWDTILPWVIGLGVLVLVIVIMVIFKGKGEGAIGFLKRMLRLGG